MLLIAHIFNIVIKKLGFFQQLDNIVRSIWPLVKCIMNTNQCLNFRYSIAEKATLLIKNLSYYYSLLLFICKVCKIKYLLYEPQIELVYQYYFGPVNLFYAQVLMLIYFKLSPLFYPMSQGCILMISLFNCFLGLSKTPSWLLLVL